MGHFPVVVRPSEASFMARIAVKGAAISVHLVSYSRNEQISLFSSDVVFDQVTGAIAETG